MRDYIVFCKEEVEDRRNLFFQEKEKLISSDRLIKSMSNEKLYKHLHDDLNRYWFGYSRMNLTDIINKYKDDNGVFGVSVTQYNTLSSLFDLYRDWVSFTKDNQIFIDMFGDKTAIDKFIENEKITRRMDLIERVTKVVGEIKDADNLYFGKNDGINGYVIGQKGKAEVRTIGAGGYNIQKYHYRVLVNKIKEKNSIDDQISKASSKTKNNKKEINNDGPTL